jgi:hypothetical protein
MEPNDFGKYFNAYLDDNAYVMVKKRELYALIDANKKNLKTIAKLERKLKKCKKSTSTK